MPIFDYRCDNPNCARVFDELCFNEEDSVLCPECRHQSTRLFTPCSNLSLNFVGPGFYVNDSKTKEQKSKKIAGSREHGFSETDFSK